MRKAMEWESSDECAETIAKDMSKTAKWTIEIKGRKQTKAKKKKEQPERWFERDGSTKPFLIWDMHSSLSRYESNLPKKNIVQQWTRWWAASAVGASGKTIRQIMFWFPFKLLQMNHHFLVLEWEASSTSTMYCITFVYWTSNWGAWTSRREL